MKKLIQKMFYATEEKPVLVCKTCDIWTAKTQVHQSKFVSVDQNIKKSKTWKRLVHTSSSRVDTYRGKTKKAKEIFFSYDLMNCIGKKHKYMKFTKPFRVPEGVTVQTW
jgi:Mg2+/Co2+ transporter CorB